MCKTCTNVYKLSVDGAEEQTAATEYARRDHQRDEMRHEKRDLDEPAPIGAQHFLESQKFRHLLCGHGVRHLAHVACVAQALVTVEDTRAEGMLKCSQCCGKQMACASAPRNSAVLASTFSDPNHACIQAIHVHVLGCGVLSRDRWA